MFEVLGFRVLLALVELIVESSRFCCFGVFGFRVEPELLDHHCMGSLRLTIEFAVRATRPATCSKLLECALMITNVLAVMSAI